MKYIWLCCIILFSACSNKKQSILLKKSQQQMHQDLARLTLIPDVPLGFVPESIVHDSDAMHNVRVSYRLINKHEVVDVEKLLKMYCLDMELLGWEFSGVFKQEHECLIMFIRPGLVWGQVVIQDSGIIIVTVVENNK